MSWGWGMEIIATLIECFCAFCFIQKTEEKRMIGRNLLLAIPITGITIWMNHFQMVSFGPVIVFLLYCSIVTWMLYREQWRDVMWLVCIFLMLVMVFDYFTMSLLGTFSVDKAFMQEVVKADSDIRKFYLLFDKILLVVFSMLFRKYLQEYVIKKKYRFIIMAGIIGVFLVYITYNFKSIYAFMGWSIYVLICVAVAILLFFYRRWKDAEIAKAELQEKVRSYMQYYEEICQKQKENERTVHDVNYHLLNLLHLFEKEEYQNCRAYLEKLLGTFRKCSFRTFTGNQAIDFIVNYKMDEAEKNGIKVIIDMDAIGDADSLEQSDINIIFGNLLDNAMEACSYLEKEKRWIEIKLNRVMKMLFITIRNPYQMQPKRVQGVFVSSKKDSRIHGIGLSSVEHCVKKYDGIFELKFDDSICSAEALIFF